MTAQICFTGLVLQLSVGRTTGKTRILYRTASEKFLFMCTYICFIFVLVVYLAKKCKMADYHFSVLHYKTAGVL